MNRALVHTLSFLLGACASNLGLRRAAGAAAVYLTVTLLLSWGCTVENPAYRPAEDPPPPDTGDLREDGSGPDGAAKPDAGVAFSETAPQLDAGGECLLRTYYRDADKDGYGDPTLTVESCLPPPGHVANGQDCDDKQAAVHPGQSAYFQLPVGLIGGYDYNCDGVEEKQYPALVSCQQAGSTCVGDGWQVYVPACGLGGLFSTCKLSDGFLGSGCGQSHWPRFQACR